MKLKLHGQILIALALALATGVAAHLSSGDGGPSGWVAPLVAACRFTGTLFFNALKMIVVPLIVASIVHGMIGLSEQRHFGRVGLKTLAFYLVSGLLAILTGLLLVNAIQPGRVSPETAQAMISQAGEPEAFLARVEGKTAADIVDIFLRMVPPNVILAATDNGQLLGLIFFSLLFGAFIGKLPPPLLEFQRKAWESVLGVMTMITDLVIRFAPIGVFALITPVIVETGIGAFRPLLLFFITVMLALGIHLFLTLPGLLMLFKIRPSKHFKATAPALLTAFSTASSASTLPVTLECMERKAGVSNRVASFTLPLGATVNMDGTALYECVVVVFIAQFYGVASGVVMDFGTQLVVVLLALLTSVGVAGIPSASLVAIALILAAVGLPVEAVGIVLVVDRVLDMCRTSVNVFSDTCAAAIVATSEGEQNLYAGV